MYNKIILLGNLTRDIELRYLSSGMALGSSGIAVNRKYKVNGESKEDVCFVDLTFFGRTAEVANQYLKKGSKILVDGRLRFEQWQDTNGNNRSKHSVTVESMQMLSSSQASYSPQASSQPAYNQNKQTAKNPPKEREIDIDSMDEDDSELPF